MIEPTEARVETRLWTGLRALVVFGAWLMGGLVGGALIAVAGFDAAGSASALTFVIATQTAAAIAAIVGFSQSAGTKDLGVDLGFSLRAKEVWGIFGGMGLQIAVGLLLVPLADWLNVEEQQQSVADVAEQTTDTAGLVLIFISFVVLAPLAEELLFRGVILRALTPRLGAAGAVFLQALIFAGLHWEPDLVVQVIGLFIIGLVLGFVTIRRGSLGLAMMLHAGVNLLGYLGLVYGDDLERWIEELESNVEAVLRLFG